MGRTCCTVSHDLRAEGHEEPAIFRLSQHSSEMLEFSRRLYIFGICDFVGVIGKPQLLRREFLVSRPAYFLKSLMLVCGYIGHPQFSTSLLPNQSSNTSTSPLLTFSQAIKIIPFRTYNTEMPSFDPILFRCSLLQNFLSLAFSTLPVRVKSSPNRSLLNVVHRKNSSAHVATVTRSRTESVCEMPPPPLLTATRPRG